MRASILKSASLLIFALLAIVQVSAQSILANKRVLWLGDSITQAGDYVTFVEYYLEKQYPSTKFDIVSIGLSSESTSCLTEKTHPFPRPCVHERLANALSMVKPQVVIACYGMNDGIYHPQSPERMQAFEQGMDKLIAAVHAAGAQLVLLTPPPFDKLTAKHPVGKDAPDFGFATPYEGYDTVLADYAKWEKHLPKNQATVIDLHSPVDAYLAKERKSDPAFSFTHNDGIHPDKLGHLLMAQIILKGLNVPIPHGDLSAELAKIDADPLYSLIKQQREARSGGWLSYVGYRREAPVKTDSIAATESENTALQQKIDTMRSAAH